MIKYHYAYDSEGSIISIDKTEKDKKYYCIGCGEEMICKKGQIRDHHFAHKNTENCNPETYLHQYVKHYIKELFDKQKHFYIKFNQNKECKNINNCQYRKIFRDNCIKKEPIKYDLKEYYNKCEIESSYRGFIADLKLISETYEPIFIEIAVTHDCEENKKNSDIRIIEIKIPSTTDKLDLSILSETEYELWNKEIKNNIQVRFYNFRRKNKQNDILDLYDFCLFFLNKNGKAQSKIIHNRCSNFYNKRFEPTSPFEIHLASKQFVYEPAVAIANLKVCTIPNCILCHNHIKSPLFNHVCNLKRNIESLSDAMLCPFYMYEPMKALNLSQDFQEGEYLVLKQ